MQVQCAKHTSHRQVQHIGTIHTKVQHFSTIRIHGYNTWVQGTTHEVQYIIHRYKWYNITLVRYNIYIFWKVRNLRILQKIPFALLYIQLHTHTYTKSYFCSFVENNSKGISPFSIPIKYSNFILFWVVRYGIYEGLELDYSRLCLKLLDLPACSPFFSFFFLIGPSLQNNQINIF